MPTKIFVTELVNAFNLNNYFSNNIYTNFTVQDGAKGKNDKIVSLFGCDGNIKKYLKEIREEITRRHYSNEEAAGGFYNLNCFPFVFDVGFNKKGKFINKNVKVVELANLMDSEVIRNLKLHFANEFQEAVEAGVTGELKTMGMTKDQALKCVRKSVQLERVDELSPYLYCISFGDGYFKEIGHPNPSGFLRLFRNVYVAKFNLRLERCGLNNSSIFYEQRDNKLYIKDITDINVIKDIVRYVKEEIALDFKTPGDVDSKVENCKDAINDLIFTVTGKFIEGYEYDVFTNKDKIKSGHSFALIPLVEVNGQVVPLSEEDAYKVKKKFYEILDDVVFSNIKGETKDELGQISSSQGPVYAFSNKQIALLLPKIMESPIAYNQINERFEFAVDLRSQQFVFPTPPPTPVPNRHLNSDEKPGPSSKLSQPQPMESPTRSHGEELGRSPRQGFMEVSDGLRLFRQPSPQLNSIAVSCVVQGPSSQSLSAAQNVPASTNLWTQQPNPLSFPVFYAQSSDISVPRFQPPTQLSSSEPSSWKVAAQNVSAALSQDPWSQQWQSSPEPGPSAWSSSAPSAGFSSWKGANKSGSASTSAPSPWSFSGPYVTQKPTFLCDKDSDDSRLPGLLTDKRPISRYSTGSGYLGSPGPQQSTPSTEEYNERSASVYSMPEWTQPPEEEKLIEALLDMFNFNNYILGKVHTNFTLEDGKIVSLLDVDTTEYFKKVRSHIINNDCGTKEVARKVYDLGQFPFVFPPNPQRDKDGKIIIADNIDDAIPNLKVHLIQEFKRDVEDEVIKKLEKEMKMKKEEVRKCIRRSVHLEKVSNPTSYLCDISFSNEYFQNQSELSEELGIDVETLFKEFKNIYVEEFKSRLKKCNLDVSLVSHDGNMLHIKNAIDIEFVKKVKKCARKEVPVNQFPRKEVIMEVPIVLQDGFYTLDTSHIPSETRPPLRQRARPIEGKSKAGKGKPKDNQDSGYSSGFVTDAENVISKAEATTSSGCESMDYENTGKKSQKRKSEDEGSPTSKSQRSGSGNSSSEEAGDSPRSNFSDSESELCMRFHGANLGRK